MVFLTALSEEENETKGLALGAVDYITKPFRAAIVRARVKNHLELKQHKDHLENLVEKKNPGSIFNPGNQHGMHRHPG